MKRTSLFILLLLPFLFLSPGRDVDAITKEEILNRYRQDREAILRDRGEIQKLMRGILKDIRERNLKFRVELNEMMKYKIDSITGMEIPTDLGLKSVVQWRKSRQDWNTFFRDYRKDYSERFQEKKKDRQDEVDKLNDALRRLDRELRRLEEKEKERATRDDHRDTTPDKEPERYDDQYDDTFDDDRHTDDSRDEVKPDDGLDKEETPYSDKTIVPILPDSKDKDKKDELAKKKEKLEQKKKEARDQVDTDIPAAPSPSARAFDWRDRGIVTPVRFQGTCGCCWAFTSASIIESNYLLRRKENVDLSEQYLLNCARDSQGRDAGNCTGGWYGHVLDYLTRNSVSDEQRVPYRMKKESCSPVDNPAYRIKTWGYVKPNAGIPTNREMKEALCKYGPLAACIKVTPAFQAYSGGIFDEHAPVSGERDINHGLVIVGWDDDKGAWLVKNSWSDRWGEKGYAWVEYGSNNIGFGAAWVLVEPVQPSTR